MFDATCIHRRTVGEPVIARGHAREANLENASAIQVWLRAAPASCAVKSILKAASGKLAASSITATIQSLIAPSLAGNLVRR